jgi:hypothetical protein
MIDDPLALVVQMIAVLAAGMYPVGFLFGACSDCCCPPEECTKCTHPCSVDTLLTKFRFNMEVAGHEFDETAFEQGTFEFSDRLILKEGDGIDGSELGGTGFALPGPGSLLNIDWPECFPSNAQLIINVFIDTSYDACGCAQCSVRLEARVGANQVGGGELATSGPVSATIPIGCDGSLLEPSSLELSYPQIQSNNPLDEFMDCGDVDLVEVFGDWVNENLLITVTGMEVDSCECGACF